MTKKILAIFVALAMMMSLAGVASAAAPNNDGVVDVLYIGWDYYGMYSDMGNALNDTYGNGTINHTYIARESGEIDQDILDALEDTTAEVIVVDMFFSDYMNTANPDFMDALAAKNNSGDFFFISVWAEDYYTGESFAPDYFDIRDTRAETTNGNVTNTPEKAWFDAMGTDINSSTNSFSDYVTLMSSIAPYF